eukprot:s168_g25.t1
MAEATAASLTPGQDNGPCRPAAARTRRTRPSIGAYILCLLGLLLGPSGLLGGVFGPLLALINLALLFVGGIQLIMVNPACTLLESCHERQGPNVISSFVWFCVFAALASTALGCRPSSEGLGRDSPDDLQEDSRGVAVPLDFLSSILHAFKRSDQVAERCLARMAEDWESQERAKVQVLLLKDFFIDVPLVSTLCLLTGNSEFESASLLNSLLQHALQIHGSRPDVVEALAGQCLQHLDAVSSALGLHLLKMRSGREVPMGEGKGEALRLSGYVVQEPLGALRVEVVQIISVLSRLVPKRLLPLVKPAVWNALAKWFFMYRCNHIFQAACSKLWVQVIRYGSPELQYQIFMNLRLFAGLCDAILTEGTCGDRWHNLAPETRCDSQRRVEKRQVTTCQARHPGGLGAIVQVVRALADTVEKSQAPASRRPLAELPQTQVLASKDIKIQEVQGFLKKMVSASNLWPQVLKALPPPATAVKIVAKAVPRSTGAFDI